MVAGRDRGTSLVCHKPHAEVVHGRGQLRRRFLGTALSSSVGGTKCIQTHIGESVHA